ncbi:DUF4194 domain-containing protein [Spirosoma pollinicola]|uniref:DUF4194 domain-containing protein n=1 Tax=Spirosoma pollinicola TaxID=2057025 RepID=A0A2K8Z0L1_9BACT|nr:DUF4194 domain-containing protein [Spirosoma pollinicola]AUD03422.1 hypothetical protein CWM47_17230 [Spirosoma pollinicola]
MDIAQIEKAQVIGALYKGPLHQQQDSPARDRLWRLLLKHQQAVRKHFAEWGGDIHLDEAEGYARLIELDVEDDIRDQLPALIEKRPLNYPTTLLVVLFRKQLIEHQRFSGENMLRVNRADIHEQLSNFLNIGQKDEAKVRDRIDESINTLERYGLLRSLGNADDEYEVRRILNSFVDIEFINEFEEKLRQYALTYFKQTPDHDVD